jgi:uncharacterized protein YcfL
MRSLVPLILSLFILFACNSKNKISSLDPINWEKKRVQIAASDSLIYESSYLSIYSEIYERNIHKTFDLTVTVSMRNLSSIDSIFITRADYYHTSGLLTRTYFDFPILLKPMETIEIVVDRDDKEGGTGGNFIFEWATRNSSVEPIFEAIMISTDNQQGVSFVTLGIKR